MGAAITRFSTTNSQAAKVLRNDPELALILRVQSTRKLEIVFKHQSKQHAHTSRITACRDLRFPNMANAGWGSDHGPSAPLHYPVEPDHARVVTKRFTTIHGQETASRPGARYTQAPGLSRYSRYPKADPIARFGLIGQGHGPTG